LLVTILDYRPDDARWSIEPVGHAMRTLWRSILDALAGRVHTAPEQQAHQDNAEILQRRARTAARLADQIDGDRAASALRALARELEARAAGLNGSSSDKVSQRRLRS
jgi:hypothetical protein